MSDRDPTRRRLLAGALAAGCVAAWPRRGAAHATFGPVQPAALPPAVQLTGSDGRPYALRDALQGRITAVQLMFTTCSATCPIQGAVFADLQGRLAKGPAELRLLSLSIDPLGDSPAALRAWLGRFGAAPQRWSAAIPRMADLDALLDFLRGRAAGADRHTPQVYLFDRKGRLVYRSADLPSGADLQRLLERVSTLSGA